jgi:hypothetical protein
LCSSEAGGILLLTISHHILELAKISVNFGIPDNEPPRRRINGAYFNHVPSAAMRT